MSKITRFILDIIHTGCYIFLLHKGYGIVDGIANNVPQHKNIVIWFISALMLLKATKDRYDSEVEESLKENE